jgi:uncharacterized protein YktB (UPF0637 family)
VSKEYRPIREVVIERAESLGLTGYAIAVAAKINGEWIVSADHVKDYLERRKHMTDGKLDAVLRVLGLRVR